MNPFGQAMDRNGPARARRAVRRAPRLEVLEERELLTTITQFADSGVFASVMPSAAIGASEGLGTGSISLGNGDLDRVGFVPFNNTLHSVNLDQPFALGNISLTNSYGHVVGSVTAATITVQVGVSLVGDTVPMQHMLQFTLPIQVAYSQVSISPAPQPFTHHTVTVLPAVFTQSNVLPGTGVELDLSGLPEDLSPTQGTTDQVPITAVIKAVAAPPQVTIDINDTATKSDDITLFNPPGSAQPYTQTIPARVTNGGAAGTFQLSVVPAGAATLDQTSVTLAAGASTEVTITPTAVSQAVNDVKIVATSDGSEVGSQTMTVVSVTLPQHVRNSDTPVGMPDRIPPRVNTPEPITVTPDLGSSGQSVTLFTDSLSPLDGGVTLNGQTTLAVTSSGGVNLSGTRQTAATGGADAGDLRLDVQVHGKDTPVKSLGFSVAAIPQNWVIAFQKAVTGNDRGFITTDTFGSDSGDVSDLTAVDVSEVIQVVSRTGSLARVHVAVGGYHPATLPGPNGTPVLNMAPDTMALPVAALAKGINDHFGGGKDTLAQTHKFRDRRTGAVDLPIANSGYTIVFDINLPPRSHVWHLTTTKSAAATTARGIFSAAGGGGPIKTDATVANPFFSGP